VIPATGGLLNSTVSSLIKLLFQPRRCAAQTCNDLLPNQYISRRRSTDQSGADREREPDRKVIIERDRN
jgi:hypothetical protein